MAENPFARNNALPYPVYGLPWVATFQIYKNDGTVITGPTGLDSEVSLNGDTYADCANEAAEIATASGDLMLYLTAAEMTADIVSLKITSTSTGALTTFVTLHPRKLVSLRGATAQGGAAGYITLDASAGPVDDIWNGCVCYISSGTGADQARMIDDYSGSTQQASVTPDFTAAPDATSVFNLYMPEGMQVAMSNLVAINSGVASGIGTPDVNVASIDDNSITAAAVADGALDDGAFAAGAFAKVFATALTESYAANGVAPTLEQALLAVLQRMFHCVKTGTALSVKQLDGSTEAISCVLDSATNPQSVLRDD